MENEKTNIAAVSLSCLLGALLFLALSVSGVLIQGFVISQYWSWFIVPLGLPSISIVHAFGLAAFVGLFKKVETKKNKDDVDLYTPAVQFVILYILYPAVALAIGSILHSFMV